LWRGISPERSRKQRDGPDCAAPEDKRPLEKVCKAICYSRFEAREITVHLLESQVDFLEPRVDLIESHLDLLELALLTATPGGSVDEGIMLFNTLRALPIELTTHNIGNVDSIGNVVFLAGAKRITNPNATFMWHGVGFDSSGPQRFELKNVRDMLDGIEAHTTRMAVTIAACTTLTKEQIHELFLQASTKDAVFAKTYGIAHEISEARIPDGSRVVHSPAA
jgi:ATP-dependent protease ClpP protease subunit